MPNETEKLTVNLGVVELAQMDILVDQGIYSNRSDVIRTALRKLLETHSERMDIPLIAASKKDNWTKMVGILTIFKKTLEKLAADNETISISVIGMLIIDAGISAELFEKTVDTVVVRGKLVAPEDIKRIIEK